MYFCSVSTTTETGIPQAQVAAASSDCALGTPTATEPMFDEYGNFACCRPVKTLDPTSNQEVDVC